MSKDIRSYFQPKKAQKSTVIEDDDVIPESPEVQIKNKKKESRNKRVIIDDSDEEIFASKKKKTDHDSKSTNKNKNKTPDKPILKEVKAVDIFGGGPIKRTEPLVKKAKKTETGIHSDEEFEKSLLEVDSLEELASIVVVQEPPPKPNVDNNAKDDKNKSSIKHHEKGREKNKELCRKKEKSPIKINGNNATASKANSVCKSKHFESNRTDKIEKDLSGSKGDMTKQHTEHRSKNFESKDKAITKEHEKSKKDHKKDEHDDSSKKEVQNHVIKEERKFDKSCSSNSVESLKSEENTPKNEKKRVFSEFVGNNSVTEDSIESKHQNKKTKLNKSLNESVLTDEERHERKLHSAALYQKYLNRSGPKHLGAKQIPEGSPNCLVNCAFLLTGVLDSFEREEIVDAVAKYGGCIKNSISKKVTHVLAGEDAGPAKMAKAQELGIKIINEDEFIQMITHVSDKKTSNKLEIKEPKRDRTPSKHMDKTPNDKKESKHKEKSQHVKTEPETKCESKTKEKSQHVKTEPETKCESKTKIQENHALKSKSHNTVNHEKKVQIKSEVKSEKKLEPDVPQQESIGPSKNITLGIKNSLMWVEKYKPQNVKQIIGQHGDASNVKKLSNWLTKWYANRKAKLPKPSPWAKNDDGGYYKAALLSGPPGVGKTTTVALVCKELGFDTVEFNASDTRNKTLIKEQIGELLTTTSLSGYARGDTSKQAVSKKHVLVMDEVDGMAGNEDRGGLQELIALIKSSSVPIICMCNDRNSQKMRSLVNYCYDLRFNRPRVEQIKSAMLSICCKEGIKIPQEALTQLIVAANQDVRQTLNLLSVWAVDLDLTDVDRLKKDANNRKKDIKLGPWEAIRKVFSEADHKTMSIHDKSDLFFYDYSLAPLFVQENYLQVAPHCPKHEVLERISRAADSISAGDLVDARIRRNQAWSLLPIQAMYSSVIPGHELSGHVAGQIQFPGWLGKNSRATKMHRLCQEIHSHTRLSTSGSKSSIYLDYSSHLRDAILNPLLKEKADGIDKSLEVLESYHLLREDIDSLLELSLWPGQRNPMILIDPKVKAAMTRTYNKKALALPYAPGSVKRVRAANGEEDEEEVEDEEDNSDPENDALIKKKKAKEEKPSSSKEKPSSSKQKASTSKEKGSSSKGKKK